MVLFVLCAMVGCRSTHPKFFAPLNTKAPRILVYKFGGQIMASHDPALADRRDAAKKAVKIEWEAEAGKTLDIVFKKDGCVDRKSKVCNANKCKFDTDLNVECPSICGYTIILDGEPQDPILVIDDN